jgi:hypothetical protein
MWYLVGYLESAGTATVILFEGSVWFILGDVWIDAYRQSS